MIRYVLAVLVQLLLSYCNDVFSVSVPLQVIFNVCSKVFKRVSGDEGVSVYSYGYFWIWRATEVNSEFLGLGCVEQVVTACPLSDSLGHLGAVQGFITLTKGLKMSYMYLF